MIKNLQKLFQFIRICHICGQSFGLISLLQLTIANHDSEWNHIYGEDNNNISTNSKPYNFNCSNFYLENVIFENFSSYIIDIIENDFSSNNNRQFRSFISSCTITNVSSGRINSAIRIYSKDCALLKICGKGTCAGPEANSIFSFIKTNQNGIHYYSQMSITNNNQGIIQGSDGLGAQCGNIIFSENNITKNYAVNQSALYFRESTNVSVKFSIVTNNCGKLKLCGQNQCSANYSYVIFRNNSATESEAGNLGLIRSNNANTCFNYCYFVDNFVENGFLFGTVYNTDTITLINCMIIGNTIQIHSGNGTFVINRNSSKVTALNF